ncbi:uncharacterized protein LOC131671979 isoform X2 [Phymastichus coffea]|uniref:uncharacterized protein LOC131671979 isoform X2 n=1 Tax=Phymastichus coffea TaxID=108790 RepID=UPI00273BF485|nr:uncharacterized protein LOC131671979 isoform X2 [Phymastichus coffea]
MLLASIASIRTITGAIEEEYANSEANSGQCDGYVTDHTDLTSDIDESEYRRELLNDRWRLLFDKFDPEGFGEIPVQDFLVALSSPEWQAEIPENKREILLLRAKEIRIDAVTFQDFVNVMSGKRTRSFKCAVHHRDREVCSENDFHLLTDEPPLFRRMVRMIGDEFLTEERDRKYYADHYTCCPPPLFIILITLVEMAPPAVQSGRAGGRGSTAGDGARQPEDRRRVHGRCARRFSGYISLRHGRVPGGCQRRCVRTAGRASRQRDAQLQQHGVWHRAPHRHLHHRERRRGLRHLRQVRSRAAGTAGGLRLGVGTTGRPAGFVRGALDRGAGGPDDRSAGAQEL